MTKNQYEAHQRGRGTALNVMNDYENNHALPGPKQPLRIEHAHG